MSDNIRTVQTDYAEAMEMLWRQAQTIKRLQQENEKLRAALKPFSAMAAYCYDMGDHEDVNVSVEDLRAAAAALKETVSPPA